MLQVDQVKRYTRASFAVIKKNRLTPSPALRAVPLAAHRDPAAPQAVEAGVAEVPAVAEQAVAGDESWAILVRNVKAVEGRRFTWSNKRTTSLSQSAH